MNATQHFQVTDNAGDTWATYLYEEMANGVADRCNNDRALTALQPFKVEPVQA